eukprot:11175538-Lingulodinium_polyedra.AAC.1
MSPYAVRALATYPNSLQLPGGDGAATERGAKVEDARYGDAVIPFVLEVGGRPSKEARERARHVVRNS